MGKLVQLLAPIVIGIPLFFGLSNIGTAYAQQNKLKENTKLTTNQKSLESKVVRLTNNDFPDEKPVYSPDGKKIAFISGSDELSIMNSNGSNQKQIKHFVGTMYMAPSWSLDGKQVVITTCNPIRGLFSFSGYIREYSEIYKLNIAKSEMKRLTSEEIYAKKPSWSPDGKQIVFFGRDEKRKHVGIYIINSDGTNQKPIKNFKNNEFPTSPVWSPDGQKIAFINKDDGGNEAIYTINPEGNEIEKHSNNINCLFSELSWSPDSKKLAFIFNKNKNTEIYTLNINNGLSKRITNNLKIERDLSWSPDSKKLAFASYGEGGPGIYTININNGLSKRITNNPAEDRFPSWSPDGNYIIFSSYRDNVNFSFFQDRNSEIYRIRVK